MCYATASWVRHISLDFREMWDSTELHLQLYQT